MQDQAVRPSSWVRNLVRLNPARFEWLPFARGILSTGVPLAIGVVTGFVPEAMLVCLGGLFAIVGNTGGSYRAQFRQLTIEGLMAAAGYACGQLLYGHSTAAIVLVTVAAVLAGVASGVGATVSLGSMLFLVLFIAAAAIPTPHPVGVPSLIYLIGTAFALALLGLEAATDRRRPIRAAVHAATASIAALARAVQAGPDADIDAERDAVVAAANSAYSLLLDDRAHTRGRTATSERGAALLATLAEVTPSLLTARTAHRVPQGVADWLTAISDAEGRRLPMPPTPPALAALRDKHGPDAPDGALVRRVEELSAALAGRPVPHVAARFAPPVRSHRVRLGVVTSRDAWTTAVRIGLCTLVAMISVHVIPGARSYWIPITVVMVIKPEFGSVFVRAVQRSIGTIVGAAAGAAILAILPKGLLLVAVLAVCTGLLPWAGRRNFALQGAILTPLVLVLFDLVVPATGTTDYWLQRTVDTVIASVIVLVFGYLIWPRSQRARLAATFTGLTAAIADFLVAACSPSDKPDATAIGLARRLAYRRLSDTRIQLQRALTEPPPSGREAAAWFPAVESAARLCDDITAEGQRRLAGAALGDPAAIDPIASALRTLDAGHLVAGSAGASGTADGADAAEAPILAESSLLVSLVGGDPDATKS